MPPYFETVKSFADVALPTDSNLQVASNPTSDKVVDGIDTETFLDAADGLLGMFELLGTGVFTFVQHDLRMNINGVRARFGPKREQSMTLEQLVHSEVAEFSDRNLRHGTACLLRLLRGLNFTHASLVNSRENPKEELRVSFRRAYDATLSAHHKFVVRTVVHVAIRACPYRADFYSRLMQDGDPARFEEEMGKWLTGLGRVVAHMASFYEREGFGRV